MKKMRPHVNVHDSVYWLPADLTKEKAESFRAFINRNLLYVDSNGEEKKRNMSELEVISKNWHRLTLPEEKLKFKDILAICRLRKYTDQRYKEFALEAARWGTSEVDYKNLENIYKAGLRVPEPFDSGKKYKFGKYTGRFLPREDVRSGFFGSYTNCCQHFDGVGSSCAISTVMDHYSQLFVIEDDKKNIVAGSWAWENTDGKFREVCFDNIEVKGDYIRHPMLNKIYEMAAKDLCEEQNCRKVTVGKGYQDAIVSRYADTKAIKLPSQYNNQYSDATHQVLLRENIHAQPLDKGKESQRYIREACFLDLEKMDHISAQCFPESDKLLQAPDPVEGFSLIDKDKGLVGYCLYSENERSIYDMAVLPKYRKDDNKSSLKLLGEMVKKVREVGGEWKAELRDKTTLRYLKAMSERGLVEWEENELDHQMSDGSQVFKVTFKPQKIDKTVDSPHLSSSLDKLNIKSA